MPLTPDRPSRARGGERRITVALRYDDFSNGSPDGLDRFLVETVVEAGLAMTVAALPYGDGPEESRPGPPARPAPLSARKADILRPHLTAGGGRAACIELAQHGFDHRPVGRDPHGRPAELSGQSRPEQVARIGEGLRLLEEAAGVRPLTFVPPWNRYDARTVEALGELGFSVLSAGREAPSPSLISSEAASALRFVPATSPPDELREAIADARRRDGTAIVVALLHPYDFVELGKPWGRLDREGFRELAEWLARQPDVRPSTLDRLPELDRELSWDRARRFARFHESALGRWVPPRREGSLERPLRVYPEARELAVLSLRRALLAAALQGSVAAAGLWAGWLLVGTVASGPVALGLRAGLAGLALLAGLRAARDGGPYFRGLVATVCLGAAALGAWLA